MKANGRLAVDTNAVIAYREGIPAVCAIIDQAELLYLPVVVLGELLYGAVNSAKPEKNLQDINKFQDHSIIMPIDESIAMKYAKVRSSLKETGHPIPENDIWVAATCLELNVPLLSRDGHFEHVKGLDAINWQEDI